MRIAVVVLSVLTAIALLGLSSANAAEGLWVIKDGVLNKEALTPEATEVAKDHVGCGGDTVDGLYVVTPTYKGLPNWARFTTAKSALGDCELPVVMLGGGGGRIKGGQNLDYLGKPDRQMCRLYLNMMDKMGVHLEEFGDAKKPLSEV